MSTKPRMPRLNHVAMSMPADALDAEGRKAITTFYGDVFGWLEYDMLTQDRHRLVMRVHSDEQPDLDIWGARRRSEPFENAFDIKLQIEWQPPQAASQAS